MNEKLTFTIKPGFVATITTVKSTIANNVSTNTLPISALELPVVTKS